MQQLAEVIIVDDEASVRESTAQWLTLSGFKVTSFSSPRQALDNLDDDFAGAIVSDVLMPQMNGLDFMAAVLQRCPNIPVILLTGHGDVDMATKAMRMGAYDFIEKPYLPERLAEQVQRACEKHKLLHENQMLQQHLTSLSGIEATLLGVSPAMQRLRHQILKLSALDTNIIIYGETGTGKELVAQCLHDYSRRHKRHFVPINCGAIPESLIESELFGHEAGAFTGANKRRIGKFEHADGGTLFLDEIETMPQFLQIKILRSLQEKVIERLGSNNLHKVDLQVIAASKVELRDNPDFRQDLFYRLNISELQIPALRERVEDIPLLFDRYLKLAVQQQAVNMRQLSADELRALMSYQWPGNVRELKNVALRYAVDTENSLMELLRPTSLSTAIGSEGDEQLGSCEVSPLAVKVASFEEQVIRMSLDKHCGNIKQTLLELDLPRRTLNQKMIRYGINRADYRND